MPLAYDPEVAVAFAGIAEAMGARPQLPVGDALGRRESSNAMFSQMNASIPFPSSVTRTNHTFKSFDGAELTIAEFRNKAGSSSNSKALYHIHGGGMILGSIDVFEKSTAKKCEETGLPVFAMGYRLAPEKPHPTPVYDCFAGLQWLSQNAERFGIDASKIIVIGESAGGGLAAGTCLLARDQNLSPPVAKQILIFPMLDDRNNKPLSGIEDLATWKVNDNLTGWGALLGDKSGSADLKAVSEYAAPARAENLAGLPPTYIDCGQLDIFIYEDTKFASRLIDAQVPTEFHTYPGLPHAYQAFAPQARYSKMHLQNVLNAVAVG
ncbi:Putative alpha/beta hydrolase-3 [Septoria linicola]|uniref:Alpha/beta hydrolase-3 n=1 Tax=Septoria linicola TaxID=215465 RepID=A0A9Q9EFV0_9PEZI|nr:Putative alpha/beta hydrolase-3 [Septoria linicola]